MEEFTIYYGILPDGRRKIGVDSNYPNRIIKQKLTDHRVLEVHTCVYEVSDRERELQARNGLKVDRIPYYRVYFMGMRKKGASLSQEHRNKIKTSINSLKEQISESMSNAKKGVKRKPFTAEHKASMSAARREQWRIRKLNETKQKET